MAEDGVSSPFFGIGAGRGRIYGSAAELIGWTPLVETKRIAEKEAALARLVVKMEGFQPGGSVKDRMALMMVLDAEQKGLLVPGVSTIVEPTSGNTGIGLALVGAIRGYKVIAIQPASYSMERRILLRALGAELVLTDPTKGFAFLFDKAMEIAASIPNAHVLNQIVNPSNPQAHYLTTGPEIWNDTDGKVDILVAGCGTGGTISGTGRFLKEKNPKVQVVAVEPEESPVLSGGESGCHGIQGIGPGFIPAVTDTSLFDQVVSVNTTESYANALRLIKEEGLLVGMSSGAVFAAALKLAKLPENKDKLIVAILPSASERYLATPLFGAIRKECEEAPVL